VSSTGGDDETRLLPRDDEALLPTVVTAFRDPPSSSRGLLAATDDDDGDHGASSSRLELHLQNHSKPPINLPMPLRILFGCNGVTLALPSTALMYIVNTRVAVPLSVLPAYASVAFLPFSLKPLYAVATHWLDHSLPPPALTTSTPTRSRSRRHVLLSILLILNSATIFGTYGARDVPSCFIWAFARGITSAWAEFLLGLALLSRVGGGDIAGSSNRRQGAEEEEEEGVLRTAATATTDDDGTGTEDTASFRASRFQAEAAAARSMGSLVAYAFTATYFGLAGRTKNGTESSAAIAESDVWNLLAVAALVHVAGSALALASRVGSSEPELPFKPSGEGGSDDDDGGGPWFGCLGRIRALLRTVAARLPTTSQDPSYHRVGAGSEVDRPIDGENYDDVNQEEVATVESDRQPLDTATSSTSFSIAATLMVGSLQAALVLMTVRQPIVGATSAGAWWCGWIACVAALVGSGVHYYSVRGGDRGTSALSRRQSHPDTTATHRVGLFLVLRHAVPSCGYLVGSYVYTLLEEHPVVLQVLAVLGSAMTTVAAWSYGRFGASSFSKIPSNAQPSPRDDPHPRHQSHHAVVPVIVITTIAAGLMSLTQLSYVYYVVPPPMVSIIVPQLGLILVVKSLTTLADEWKFLPDVVLATLSAVEEDEEEEVAASAQMEAREADTASTCSLPRRRWGEPNDEARGSGSGSHSLERDLKYGSLISCIDFGEQLGSLLMGPLVAVLGVTRDGAQGRWVHFDRLIIVGALLSVMSLLLLWILPGVNLSTIFHARFSPSSGYRSRHS
jgi:hypothetical protein